MLARASMLLNRFLSVNFRYLASTVMRLALSSLFNLKLQALWRAWSRCRETNPYTGLEWHRSNFAKPFSAMA
jgi:hypothetical protein